MAQGSQKTVLVVEDQPNTQIILQKILKHGGYQVELASDGKEGVKKTRAILPDLILMDVVMPEMNGFEALEKIKEDKRTRHIPVIILTGEAGSENVARGMQNFAEQYIVKPFEGKQILDAVGKALSLKLG